MKGIFIYQNQLFFYKKYFSHHYKVIIKAAGRPKIIGVDYDVTL